MASAASKELIKIRHQYPATLQHSRNINLHSRIGDDRRGCSSESSFLFAIMIMHNLIWAYNYINLHFAILWCI